MAENRTDNAGWMERMEGGVGDNEIVVMLMVDLTYFVMPLI